MLLLDVAKRTHTNNTLVKEMNQIRQDVIDGKIDVQLTDLSDEEQLTMAMNEQSKICDLLHNFIISDEFDEMSSKLKGAYLEEYEAEKTILKSLKIRIEEMKKAGE